MSDGPSNHDHTELFSRNTETLSLVLGLVLFIWLIYGMLPLLSPVVLVLALVFLLYPARHYVYVRRIMWLAVFLVILWFLSALIGVLTPFIIAFLLAYIFDPVVEYLERRGLPRWLSSLTVIIVLIGSLVTVTILLAPVVISQTQSIINNVSEFVRNAITFIRGGRLMDFFERLGVPRGQVEGFLADELPTRLEGVLRSILEGIVRFITNVSAIISQLLNLIIIPFVAFYLLMDYRLIFRETKAMFPAGRREKVAAYFERVDEVVGNYVRGVLVVSLIQGVLTGLGLLILDVKYAVVLGGISGLLNIIPFVGFYSSLVFSLIAAFLSGGAVAVKVIGTVILYVGLNLLETVVLSPKIVGTKVGLHPVALIIALTVFGYFMGFIGLLIAVPATALIIMTVKFWREQERELPPVAAGAELPPLSDEQAESV